MRSKKGVFLAGTMLDFMGYIIFILTALLFFALFAAETNTVQNKITANLNQDEAGLTFRSMLKSPMSLENPDYTFADYIIMHSVDAVEQDKAYTRALQMLLPFCDYDKNCAWRMKMSYSDIDLDKMLYDPVELYPTKGIAEQSLPTRQGELKVVFAMGYDIKQKHMAEDTS